MQAMRTPLKKIRGEAARAAEAVQGEREDCGGCRPIPVAALMWAEWPEAAAVCTAAGTCPGTAATAAASCADPPLSLMIETLCLGLRGRRCVYVWGLGTVILSAPPLMLI